MGNEGHKFDRRVADANVAALSLRVSAMESRVEVLEHAVRSNNRELAANTSITEQIHGQTSEMYEIFDSARKWFVFAGKIGAAGLWMVEKGGKATLYLLFICGVTVAVYHWVTTGHFTLPDWARLP